MEQELDEVVNPNEAKLNRNEVENDRDFSVTFHSSLKLPSSVSLHCPIHAAVHLFSNSFSLLTRRHLERTINLVSIFPETQISVSQFPI